MSRLWNALRSFTLRDAGNATVEFVIAVPIVLSILFSSIDHGAIMLRQVFLDRATDIAVREVLLGNVSTNGLPQLRRMICDGTILIPDCENSLTIELRPINTNTWAGLNDPALCIDRSANITPTLTFNPSAGNQDLMLVRVCAAARPFIDATALVMGLNKGSSGDYLIVSTGAFTNEPS